MTRSAQWVAGGLRCVVAVCVSLIASCATAPVGWERGNPRLDLDLPVAMARLHDDLIAMTRVAPLKLVFQVQKSDLLVSQYIEGAGTEHGVLLFKRAWQRRIRLVFRLKASTPEAFTQLTIDLECQERPNPNYEWQEQDPSRCAGARLDQLAWQLEDKYLVPR